MRSVECPSTGSGLRRELCRGVPSGVEGRNYNARLEGLKAGRREGANSSARFKVPYARSNFCSGRAESTGAEERGARLAAAIMSDSPRPVMPEGPKSSGRHGSVCRIDDELGRAWHDSGRGKCGLGIAVERGV